MKIKEILAQGKPTLSFEVFPPKTEAAYESVEKAAGEIAKLKPSFMSVTYGAGGGTSRYTVEIASMIQDLGVTPLAHLTCVSSTREKVHQVLEQLREKRIENVLALRGDIPADGVTPREYRYASQLIREIKEFGDFLLAKVHFKTVAAMIEAVIKICVGFRKLHNKGYSYQDLNDGNFFINPENGDVLICDNDNVAPSGKSTGILGKCRYMAPEIVRGEKLPDAQSDRFSLAVILFLLFFNNHPLEGEQIANCPCMTEKHEKKFYGSNPIFIYDPQNTNNRPVAGIHVNVINLWSQFPKYVQDVFIDQFSQKALMNANYRITEKEWLEKVLLRMIWKIHLLSVMIVNISFNVHP